MIGNKISLTKILLLACPVVHQSLTAETFNDPKWLASEIVRASGVTGGLCVHLGCGDGRLTAELRQDGRFLVHGISPIAASVRTARKSIQAQGIYGPVSVDRCTLKQLPYTKNLVNLVVVDDLSRALNEGLTFKEILRVLVPGGTAFVGQRAGAQPPLSKDRVSSLLSRAGIRQIQWSNKGGLWAKFRKPVALKPETWRRGSHFLNGNAVYQDASGPFTHLQWAAGPKIPGERYRAVNSYTSANGRNFCVFKEPPSGGIPGKIVLVARDAFNGLLLWQCPIDPGALLAVGDRVYAMLEGSLKSFDAATGKVLIDYQTGRHVGRCFVQGGILFIISRRDLGPSTLRLEKSNGNPKKHPITVRPHGVRGSSSFQGTEGRRQSSAWMRPPARSSGPDQTPASGEDPFCTSRACWSFQTAQASSDIRPKMERRSGRLGTRKSRSRPTSANPCFSSTACCGHRRNPAVYGPLWISTPAKNRSA